MAATLSGWCSAEDGEGSRVSPPTGSFQGAEDGEGASMYGSWEADWLTWWMRSPAKEEVFEG